MRDGPRALSLVEGILKSQENPELDVIETLAMALAEIGRFRNAAEVQAKMIAELQRSGRDDLAKLEKANLQLYTHNQACSVAWRDDDPVFSPVPGKIELAVPEEISTLSN